MTEALLFDYNGVITDDEEQHRASFAELLAEVGIPLSRDQYYAEYLGCDDRTAFVDVFRRAGKPLDAPTLEALVARKSQIYTRLIEDSLAGLSAARAAGMRCVMLTTSHPAAALAAADLVWTSFAGHDPAELTALGDA